MNADLKALVQVRSQVATALLSYLDALIARTRAPGCGRLPVVFSKCTPGRLGASEPVAETSVRSQPCVVIVGDPGSGKTAWLKEQARLIADEQREQFGNQRLGLDDVCFPAFLSLPQLVEALQRPDASLHAQLGWPDRRPQGLVMKAVLQALMHHQSLDQRLLHWAAERLIPKARRQKATAVLHFDDWHLVEARDRSVLNEAFNEFALMGVQFVLASRLIGHDTLVGSTWSEYVVSPFAWSDLALHFSESRRVTDDCTRELSAWGTTSGAPFVAEMYARKRDWSSIADSLVRDWTSSTQGYQSDAGHQQAGEAMEEAFFTIAVNHKIYGWWRTLQFAAKALLRGNLNAVAAARARWRLSFTRAEFDGALQQVLERREIGGSAAAEADRLLKSSRILGIDANDASLFCAHPALLQEFAHRGAQHIHHVILGAEAALIYRVLAVLRVLLRRGLPIAAIVFLGWRLLSPPSAPPPPDAFKDLIVDQEWIAYEPTNYDRKRDAFPSPATVREDLDQLTAFGFTGIITYSSRGRSGEGVADATDGLAALPDEATKRGLHVIEGVRVDPGTQVSFWGPWHALEMSACRLYGPFGQLVSSMLPVGISDATLSAEVSEALRHGSKIDGYIVGHNAVPSRGLFQLMDDVRCRTGKPVTTTLPIDAFRGEVAQHVNWWSPDLGTVWRGGNGTPDAQIQRFNEVFGLASHLVTESGKPALLQVVTFPSGGHQLYDEETQREFFEQVLSLYRTQPGYERSTYTGLAPFLAYDSPWKSAESGEPAEDHTGLFTTLRTPKAAACEFARPGPNYRSAGSRRLALPTGCPPPSR